MRKQSITKKAVMRHLLLASGASCAMSMTVISSTALAQNVAFQSVPGVIAGQAAVAGQPMVAPSIPSFAPQIGAATVPQVAFPQTAFPQAAMPAGAAPQVVAGNGYAPVTIPAMGAVTPGGFPSGLQGGFPGGFPGAIGGLPSGQPFLPSTALSGASSGLGSPFSSYGGPVYRLDSDGVYRVVSGAAPQTAAAGVQPVVTTPAISTTEAPTATVRTISAAPMSETTSSESTLTASTAASAPLAPVPLAPVPAAPLPSVSVSMEPIPPLSITPDATGPASTVASQAPNSLLGAAPGSGVIAAPTNDYVVVKGGLSRLDDYRWGTATGQVNTAVDEDLGGSWVALGAYGFGNVLPWDRGSLEIEGGYRNYEVGRHTGFPPAVPNGDVRIISGALNVVQDLWTSTLGLEPYVGAGLGMAYIEHDNHNSAIAGVTMNDDDDFAAFGQAFAGLKLKTANLGWLVGEARYIHSLDVTRQDDSGAAFKDPFKGFEYLLGYRMNF